MKGIALLSTAAFLSLLQGGQSCLQNLPWYANQGKKAPRFLENVQALVPAYTFSCHGNITKWGVYVEPPFKSDRYNIEFQVWRPLKTGSCYVQVGENVVSNASPQNQQVTIMVHGSSQIQVQPGDIVGFNSSHLTGTTGGVEVDTSASSVTVASVDSLADSGEACVRIGGLMKSGAPVLTAVVATATLTELNTQPVTILNSHEAQTTPPPPSPPGNEMETKLVQNDVDPPPSSSSPSPSPSPSSSSSADSNLVLLSLVGGAVGMALIVITLFGVLGCVLCHKRRRRKGAKLMSPETHGSGSTATSIALQHPHSTPQFPTSPRKGITMTTNMAYCTPAFTPSPRHAIPVSINMAYGTTNNTRPARALSQQTNRVHSDGRHLPPSRATKSFNHHRVTGAVLPSLPLAPVTIETVDHSYDHIYDTADMGPHLHDATDSGSDQSYSGYVINQLTYDYPERKYMAVT